MHTLDYIYINNTPVHVLEDNDSAFALIALALNNDTFSIEHEQDADYGRMNIYTLEDGLHAYVREISEHQIESGRRSGLFAHAYVKTVVDYRQSSDDELSVRFWEVEVHEDTAEDEAA